MSRYLGFHDYFTEVFGQKVLKLSLEGSFTCPNRDGFVGVGGCLFCAEDDVDVRSQVKVSTQMEEQRRILAGKWPEGVYIAYFQNHTNTYGGIERLRELFYTALEQPGVVGLAIATRGDCLGEDVLDLLTELNQHTFLWVELGMQTIREDTLDRLNRGYGHQVFDDAVNRLSERGIRCVCHVIFGLPGEDERDWMHSVDYVSAQDLFGIKIHSLFIQSNSPIYALYLSGELIPLDKNRYISAVCTAIARTKPSVVFHRLTGDGNKEKLVAPLWAADKLSVLGSIHRELKQRRIVQGMDYPNSNLYF
ncbi:MAG: TIGR01212 family radical SAM protein [Tissierellia bacterium]|nr:TIGR01212 family radical SAM protein [Tissierellia bacterium]